MSSWRARAAHAVSRTGSRGTLADQAHAILREQIVWEEIPPGTRLGEAELAEQLGFSRTPIRQALHRLEADGLLARVGSRLTVAPFELDVAIELLILRELLEPFAAEQSAPRLSAPEIARLRSILAEMATTLEDPQPPARYGAELNMEFHALLNARCPYPRIVDTIQVARDANSALRLYSGYSPADLRRVHDEHREIVDVAAQVNAGNAPAPRLGALIKHHMAAARASLLRGHGTT